MVKLSVFTIVAAVVYIVGVSRNAALIAEPYELGLQFITVEGTQARIRFVGLASLLVACNVAFGARLYLHAWILDESREYRRAMSGVGITKRLVQWLLRVGWVVGAAWLPDLYGQFAQSGVTILGASIHLYLAIIGILLLAWDLLMARTVVAYSSRSKKDLRMNWLWLDVIIGSALVISWLLQDTVLGPVMGNSGLYLRPLTIVVVGSISSYQIGVWTWLIVRAATA